MSSGSSSSSSSGGAVGAMNSMMPDMTTNYKPQAYALFSIIALLSVIAVMLRFQARQTTVRRLYADDWLVLAAVIINLAFQGTLMGTVYIGLGRSMMFVTNWKVYAQITTAAYTFNPTIMCLLKLSLMVLFARIFPPRWFQISLQVLGAFLVCATISTTLVQIFPCIPYQNPASRMLDPNAKCVNYLAPWWFMGSVNVVTDVILLLAPVPHLLQLHASTSHKLQLLACFAVGGFILVISCIRMALISSFTTAADPVLDSVKPLAWSATECGLGVVCACLPTCRSLWSKAPHDTVSLRSESPATPTSIVKAPGAGPSHFRSRNDITHGAPQTFFDGPANEKRTAGVTVTNATSGLWR